MEPLSIIAIGAAVGGAAGKFVEKAWDSGEKWIQSYFKDHKEVVQQKATDNTMDFLNEEFPNPKAMINEIHSMNAHMIISIWSSFGPATKQYRELDKIGALYNFRTWPESGLTSWPPNMEYPSGVRASYQQSVESSILHYSVKHAIH